MEGPLRDFENHPIYGPSAAGLQAWRWEHEIWADTEAFGSA